MKKLYSSSVAIASLMGIAMSAHAVTPEIVTVSEPSAMLLLGLGLAVVGFLRRKK
ncbi:MAG: PEP-CTERM sorting domain-containing protein [Gammaproteobacteria bacterium]